MSNDINSYAVEQTGNLMKKSTGSMIPQIIQMGIFVAIFIIFIYWSRYKSKQEQKKREEMFNNIKINDTVQTTTGIIGIVSFISGDRQLMEIKTGIDFSNKIIISATSIISTIDANTVNNTINNVNESITIESK